MGHIILVNTENHYQCNDVDKFYNKLTELAEKKGGIVEDILSYFYLRHLTVLDYHLTMINSPDVVFTGSTDFIQDAQNMTQVFEKWLPEGKIEEAERLIKEFKDNFTLQFEEEE